MKTIKVTLPQLELLKRAVANEKAFSMIRAASRVGQHSTLDSHTKKENAIAEVYEFERIQKQLEE